MSDIRNDNMKNLAKKALTLGAALGVVSGIAGAAAIIAGSEEVNARTKPTQGTNTGKEANACTTKRPNMNQGSSVTPRQSKSSNSKNNDTKRESRTIISVSTK